MEWLWEEPDPFTFQNHAALVEEANSVLSKH